MTTPRLAHQFERTTMKPHEPDPDDESNGWDTFTRVFAATLLPLGIVALIVIVFGVIISYFS